MFALLGQVVFYDVYSVDSFAACCVARKFLGLGVHYEGLHRVWEQCRQKKTSGLPCQGLQPALRATTCSGLMS